MDLVTDKMVSDYNETDPRAILSFLYHLGGVVYSFGEAEYYHDYFYDPFRDYLAPIFAVPGNHDGMVAPNTSAESLAGLFDNFCSTGQPPRRTPESGGLARTAQVQPGVYLTFETPLVRILSLYRNCLEDPGVMAGMHSTPHFESNADPANPDDAKHRFRIGMTKSFSKITTMLSTGISGNR